MAEGFEVDYTSLRAFVRRLSRTGVGAVTDIPQGAEVYGFPVLAQAVQSMTAALRERLSELEEQIAAARADLDATARSYEVADEAVAQGLAGGRHPWSGTLSASSGHVPAVRPV